MIFTLVEVGLRLFSGVIERLFKNVIGKLARGFRTAERTMRAGRKELGRQRQPAFRIQIVGLNALRRDLSRLSPTVSKQFQRDLRSIANTVAADARRRSSWSKRIPRAIRPTVAKAGTGIRLYAKAAPHGPLYEFGKSFRHPLFGDRQHWYRQATRPYMMPAVEAHEAEIMRRANLAVDRAIAELKL